MMDATHQTAATTATVLTLPNAISLARLASVPITVALILRAHWAAAFALFAAAGLSDALDGWLARHGRRSALGAVLDPAADKALLISMYITLALVRLLPAWLAALVVARDALIVSGLLLLRLRGHRIAVKPLGISKVNTALQIALVTLVLAMQAAGLAWRTPVVAGSAAVTLTTAASLAAYIHLAARAA
jgi:cardiolipin synthase